MSEKVTDGALWLNEIDRLEPLGPRSCDYALTEASRRVTEVASAMQVDAEVVRERLERGCRVFGAQSRDDTVVAWLWVSTGRERAQPIRQELHFAPDECYSWDAGTLPAHRGRGLFTALLRHAGWRMAREGYRFMWGGILDSNLASRHSCVGAGYRPVLRLTAIHEPPPTRLHVRPADYADEALVQRALRVLGDERVHVAGRRTHMPGGTREDNELTTTGRQQPDGRVAAALQERT